MHVPIPVVILLILAVMGGTWWSNTRHMDFLTPPSETALAALREKIKASFPPPAPVAEPVPALPSEPPPVEEPVKPRIELGDLTMPPTLQSYGEVTPQGPEHLIGLAAALEEKGEFQRALLAWERVVDFTKADARQSALAISSIKRLRPTLPDWNSKPESAIAIVLHAGTGKKLAKTLLPVLEGVARDLERASSGILKVKPSITTGKTTANGPAPVALWLAGPDRGAASTEVVSFTVESQEGLREETLRTVFLLIRSHLSRATAYTPPAPLTAGENPLDALESRVTRLCWNEFAVFMNLPQKKGE